MKAFKNRKYGEKTAVWSPDHHSNLQAMDAGYNVVHPRTMPDEERCELREVAGVRSTRNLFGQKGVVSAWPVTPNETMLAFPEWVTELDNRLGLTATVVFINAPRPSTWPPAPPNTKTPTLTFNAGKLSDYWRSQRNHPQLAVVILASNFTRNTLTDSREPTPRASHPTKILFHDNHRSIY